MKETCLFDETVQFVRNCVSLATCCLLQWILKWELQRCHSCGCTHLPTHGFITLHRWNNPDCWNPNSGKGNTPGGEQASRNAKDLLFGSLLSHMLMKSLQQIFHCHNEQRSQTRWHGDMSFANSQSVQPLDCSLARHLIQPCLCGCLQTLL